MITALLSQSVRQAVTQLAMYDADTFDQILQDLLDVMADPVTPPAQVLAGLALAKAVRQRVASNPYISLQLIEMLVEIGDTKAAAEIGCLAMPGAEDDADVRARLAAATRYAFLAVGAYADDRLAIVKDGSPQPSANTAATEHPSRRIGFVFTAYPERHDSSHPLALIPSLICPEFSIFVYSLDPKITDSSSLSEQLGLPIEQSRALGGKNSQKVIDIIRSDNIDILIDLGHMSNSIIRDIFLKKPAQASILWQGDVAQFLGEEYDFIIASESVILKDEHITYRGAVLSIPDHVATESRSITLPPLPEPAMPVSLGVLCRPDYISTECLQSWASILQILTEVRLIIVLPELQFDRRAAHLVDRMRDISIPLDRIIFRAATGDLSADHLGMSVVLDSFPTNDVHACYRAVLSGIPVVTVKSDFPAGRLSSVLLRQIGVEALAASDATAYVELAVALACQPASDYIALCQLLRGGVSEATSRPLSPLIAQLHTHLRNAHVFVTQINNVTPEKAIEHLSQCDEDFFNLALHRLMYEYMAENNLERKIRALKITSNLSNRVVNYVIPTINIMSSLVSVSDFETSGNIGYLAYSTAPSETFRNALRKGTLFCLSAGTDNDSRRVNELAIAKGKLELLPHLQPRWRPRPAAGRRIRVGYVFSFFHLPAYHVHTRPILELYDRDGFDVFVYGLGAFDTNAEGLAVQLKLPADRVRALGGLDDQDVADIIRRDDIDVLVELDGFSNLRRDGVFLRRPAAINVLWYNTPYTLGIELYDFVIADPIVLSPEERAAYSEEIVDMPHSVYSWMTQGELPPVADAPCTQNGYITFGSFNRMDKLSMLCLESWAEILRRVPTARLLLHYPTLRHKDIRLWQTDRMIRAGLPMDRVTLRVGGPEMINWQTFMSSYGDIDIGLDPYPYCGGHTSYDTVCMGVPLVCYLGKRYPSRISASIVTACDLPDLVAPDRDGYIEMAVRLAQETPEQLTARRHDIRRRVLGSPFRRWQDFVRALEGHYRYMVDRAQAWPERQP